MSKPEWNEDTPKWANWLAQDLDGMWHWYPSRPTARSTVWMNDEEEWFPAAYQCPMNPNWKNTLEPRP